MHRLSLHILSLTTSLGFDRELQAHVKIMMMGFDILYTYMTPSHLPRIYVKERCW